MVYFTVRLAEQPAFVQAVSAVRLCVIHCCSAASAAAGAAAAAAAAVHATVSCVTHSPSVPSCASHFAVPCQVPDYDESIIHKTVEALAAKQLGEYEHRRRLLALAAGEWDAQWQLSMHACMHAPPPCAFASQFTITSALSPRLYASGPTAPCLPLALQPCASCAARAAAMQWMWAQRAAAGAQVARPPIFLSSRPSPLTWRAPTWQSWRSWR